MNYRQTMSFLIQKKKTSLKPLISFLGNHSLETSHPFQATKIWMFPQQDELSSCLLPLVTHLELATLVAGGSYAKHPLVAASWSPKNVQRNPCPKNHGISKLMIWRSPEPCYTESNLSFLEGPSWFLGWYIFNTSFLGFFFHTIATMT